MKNKDNTFLLPTIVFLALALRLIGINHGYPFIFHPDEPTVVRTALSLRFFPNPGHFDWPHLFMYANYVLYLFFGQFRKLIEILELKNTVAPFVPVIWNDSLIYYYLSRIFAAVLGALTVIPIYIAGRSAFGKSVGILAALTMAILPFHVWHSHYALIDVPMLFFASWGLFFGLNILRRKNVRDYTGAGFYLGLAASTKYNAALTTLIVPFAHILRAKFNKEKILDKKGLIDLVLSGFTFIVGFLLGTPYALLDYQTFLRTDGPKGALWQFTNVGSLDLVDRLPAFFNRMVFKVADDVGYTVMVGFVVVLGLLLYRLYTRKTNPEDAILWFLVSTCLFFLIYVSGVKNSRSHYYFIAYPYLVLVFAYLVDMLMRKLSQVTPVLGFVIFMFALGIPSFLAVKSTLTFTRSDTRVSLYTWLKSNYKPTDTLVYNKSSLSQVTSMFAKGQRLKPQMAFTSPTILIVGYDNEENSDMDNETITVSGVKKFATINNTLRLGPKIEIYTINR